MIANKKEFYGGFALLGAFIVTLAIIFSPIFKGHNGLEYMDALYNSISKGSAYYIPDVLKETSQFKGQSISVTVDLRNAKQAQENGLLFRKGGASVTVAGPSLRIKGDLGEILANALDDADEMYQNKGDAISKKYGYDERQVLFNWWKALNALEKALTKQKKFKEAKAVALVVKKAVEPSYNYYTIEPQKITDRMGVVIFSLVFYVIYTLWYGFAVMYMFEGWGMRLEH
ncbi:MAG: hypothetical protein J7M32_08055 [Deltaproteobacteria bacterium]|nr:hypothetical protein [Deltaproteobacteria bacterium]